MYHLWTALLGSIALAWVITAIRVWRGMSRLPKLRGVTPLRDAECPSVSILVAARDEATRLPQSLPTLLAQDYPRYEVIVVDDRSRDATPEVLDELARKYENLQVIHVTELPAGWLGKPHATAKGYQQASGEWLVFTDADVHFAPDVLRRVMAVAKEKDWEHLNVLPHLELVGFWEKTVLSFWALSSILWLEPWRVSNPRSRRYFGFGALQALRRNAYEAIGTHRHLAMEVVDDIKLGKLAKQAGLRSGVAIAGDKVRLRYLEGLNNIVRGVSKSAFAACGYRASLIAGGVIANLVFHVSPFVAVLFAAGVPRAFAAAAVFSIVVLHGRGLIAVRVSPLYTFTYPLGVVVFCYILLHSMVLTFWRGGVLWRDTFYPLEELRKGVVFSKNRYTMSSSNLVRWSGFAGMVGGLLWLVLVPLTDYAWNHPIFGLSYEDYNRIMPVPRVFILASLIGFYVRHQGRSGRLGLAGFAVAVLGLTLMLAGGVVEFWLGGGARHGNMVLSSAGWNMVIAGVPTLYVGLMLLGAATVRARVLAGWKRAAPLVVVAILPVTMILDLVLRRGLGLEGPLISITSFGLGWLLLGYALYQETNDLRSPGSSGA